MLSDVGSPWTSMVSDPKLLEDCATSRWNRNPRGRSIMTKVWVKKAVCGKVSQKHPTAMNLALQRKLNVNLLGSVGTCRFCHIRGDVHVIIMVRFGSLRHPLVSLQKTPLQTIENSMLSKHGQMTKACFNTSNLQICFATSLHRNIP